MKRQYTSFVDLMSYYRNFIYSSAMDKVEDIKVIVSVAHTVYYESFDGEATEVKDYEISIGRIPDGNYHKILKAAADELGKKYDTKNTLHIKSTYTDIKRFDLYTRF